MKTVTTKMATVVFTPVKESSPEMSGEYLVLLLGEAQSITGYYNQGEWFSLGSLEDISPTHWAYFPTVTKTASLTL